MNKGQISDGYHTFDELYYHRMMLFSVICNQNRHRAWKSKEHDDGSMFDNYFIAGITTPEGEYTYHYHLDHWDYFDVRELDRAPAWDGHKPEDITRLQSLLLEDQNAPMFECDGCDREFNAPRVHEEKGETACPHCGSIYYHWTRAGMKSAEYYQRAYWDLKQKHNRMTRDVRKAIGAWD